MSEPLGLPEPCGRPRLELACSKCDAWASWIIPSPAHRGLVLELAGRAGWTGITVGPCRCADCGPASDEPSPMPAKSGRPRLYPARLLDELAAQRAGGSSWRKIACRAAQATGRDVCERRIAASVRNYRARAKVHV